ncbi:serine/threonine-protein kinase [Mariniblastus fucicola]|uniref:Serine/threonine-protein kinase PrkC n=1 Tax=Mariniblastus fucicola TaxID=980251 RepID=A0A5B9PIK8_9BACT|nr:serine/threonine-protein kinase [Mariniblastus fucicola]QEG22591.1 Serine/threonine-protein kinase PrkC [Mariniblastus fucicola]
MPRICSQCSSPVTEELPGGLCPSCLLKIARKPRSEAATMASAAQIPGMQTAPGVEELSRQFPELEIIELVGQGGMGAVYKAKQRNLDRLVALKIFLYRANDPEFAERFKREARALGRLSHPNIVAVHNFGIRESMHFLVMEFVDGLNLRQITEEARLDPLHAMQLVPELCDALQYAHSEGVIHRDIKPENILLDTRGRIKIADFGLAKIAGPGDAGLTHTQQVMGTWNYMAPEQKERPTEVDHRADIYSLGVVIYEMLTGELPLGRFQVPSAKASIDTRLDEVVMRALEKEPERRYQHASEFKYGFASYADAAPIPFASAAPVSAAQPEGAMAAVAAIPAPPVKATEHHVPSDHIADGMRLHVCVMSGREKKGRWKVGDPNIALTLMGGSCLDLTEVLAREVSIVSFVVMGGIDIVVPHGAIVDVDGLILMGATTDKVKYSTEPVANPMRVRVRSFGLMGGCEVRTTRKRPPSAAIASPPRKQGPRPFRAVAHGAVFLAQAIAMLVTLAVPIMFMLGAFNIISDDEEANMIGVVTAIACGMFWALAAQVRAMVQLPKPDASPDDIAEMERRTVIGSAIRMLAVVTIFACPILFVINRYEHHDDELKFAAIVCAILGVALFMIASKADEFFNEHFNRQQH